MSPSMIVMIKCEGYLVKRYRIAVAFGTEKSGTPAAGDKACTEAEAVVCRCDREFSPDGFPGFQKRTLLVSTPCRCSIIIPVILAHNR
jgi:hypothetical protein